VYLYGVKVKKQTIRGGTMRIKNLKICGFDVPITYKKLVVEGGDSCLGCCKSDSNSIEIKKGITKQRENEVILHEAFHFISDVHNLDLTENQVNTFGVVFIEFIVNNNKFMNKITEEN